MNVTKTRTNKEKLTYMVKLLEHSQKDYKLVRGICSILERKCAFGSIFESDKNTNSRNFDPSKEWAGKLTPAGIKENGF